MNAASGPPTPPAGWSTTAAQPQDVDSLAELLSRHEQAARGWSSASPASVAVEVTGRGAATRRHRLVLDAEQAVRAWGSVHDRAAGRVVVSVVVDPALPGPLADDAAAVLFDWSRRAAADLGAERDLAVTQLDSGAFADDARQQGWLTGQGFSLARSWWQMTRPVEPAEGEPGTFATPSAGLTLRRVRVDEDDVPLDADLHSVHDVLEASFSDHFNSHQERFEEFVTRLREGPGHRWDHWWIAELDDATGGPRPVGAVVASALTSDDDTATGSYIEYLGVLSVARGRGAARSLLSAVIADAAARGRGRVGLEVDAVNPTGAARLYTKMGFVTRYVTESWHQDVSVRGAAL